VEAIVLSSPEPISPARIAEVLPRCNPSQVRAIVRDLNEEYVARHSAFEIWEVAGGYQLRTRPDLASFVAQMHEQRPARLSRAALETLAIVAYRQPVTRAEIEHVRGVDVGPILRGLIERKLVRIAGHRDVPGRPILYATTRRFLEVFGLPSLRELPTLRELSELLGEEGLDGARLAAIGGEAAGAVLPLEAGAVDPTTGEPLAPGSGAPLDPTADDPEPVEVAPPGGLH
jgi:segregation and condensation protein B